MQTNDMKHDISTERRDVLKGAGMLGVGALAASTVASVSGLSEAFASEHGAHQHHMSKNTAMTDALYACVKAANLCEAHCIKLIKTGDLTMVDCLRSVTETKAFCEAHAYHSAAESKYLNDLCRLSLKICKDCMDECEKHAKKHIECKNCADTCANCIKACEAHLKA